MVEVSGCYDGACYSEHVKPTTPVGSYVVTHWVSGISKEISFGSGESLKRFLTRVGIVMKVGRIDRLYALLPGQSHDQRSRIENTDQLVRYLSMVDETEDYIDILYVYPNEDSPASSPNKVPQFPAASDSSRSSSDVSSDNGRSTYQKRFRTELLRRDKERCLLCSTDEALIGAHIVDVDATLTDLEKEQLDMKHTSDRYAVYNGLLLCANCRTSYDNWKLGVDGNGYLVKRDKDALGGWSRTTTNVYPDPEDRFTNPKNPLGKLLTWKYEKFISKRDKTSTKVYNTIVSYFTPTKGKKN
jgi:hypothetical protein